MQGLSELLLAKNLDESSEKQVERIHKESLRLSSLITDMLELSRLENGGQSEMILSEVNLKETVEEALGELSAKMAEKGVTATERSTATRRKFTNSLKICAATRLITTRKTAKSPSK